MVRLLYDKSNKCSTQTVRQKSLDIGIYVPMGRLIGYFSFMQSNTHTQSYELHLSTYVYGNIM
jgi:hypothetical protein